MTGSVDGRQAIGADVAGRKARRVGWTRRSLLTLYLMAVVAAIGAAGFSALGVWQLERRAWKLDLIDRVERRVHAAPVSILPAQAWSDVNGADHAYRRVVVNGRFLHDRETLVQAVTERGPGFWVLTPLRMDGGGTVLVNRGFVPPDRRDPAARQAGNPPGEVRLTGLLRLTEPHGGFLRANDPAADRWYSRDVTAIAAARSLSDTAPFFVDADATTNPGGWPVGGLTVVTFRNDHMVYALTWFALALMAGGAALFVALEGWRLRKCGLDTRSNIVSESVHRDRRSFAALDRRS